MILKFIKRYIPIIICAVIFLLVGAVHMTTVSDWNAKMVEQQGQIDSLTNKKLTLEAALDSGNADITKQTTGLDLARKKTDDEKAEEFFKATCTWDSYESYEKARKAATETYAIEEDSQFMTIFLPKVETFTAYDGKGEGEHNVIDDNGLNMSYSGLSTHVIGISGDKYSYVAEMTVKSADKVGNEAKSKTIVFYTINSDGDISGVSAEAVSK